MWSRYFHTLRHLRASQITGRLIHRLHQPRPDARPAPAPRDTVAPWVPPCERPASLLSADEARFLNQTRRLQFPSGWNDPASEKLWLYNLHYFEGLLAPGDASEQALRRGWVARWIQDNPPGLGNGWEPYPLSLRICHWIKWFRAGQTPDPAWLHSLAVQVRYLSGRIEHHLLGNHLFENAKALVFAGHFFGGEEGARWRRTGEALLHRELAEQLLADGGHFERSPMYHALVLDGVLDLHNLHQCHTGDATSPWRDAALSMLDWQARLVHPDGDFAFFNDAALGIAPTLAALRAYAQRLGLPVSEPAVPPLWVGASGYARLQSGPAVVLADVAPVGPDHQPGHAHADTLSFECSFHGRRLLVNGGTSTYVIGAERQRQRGTAAHNTVRIDELDSSEVWAGFRVARRARVRVERIEEGGPLVLQASHDGYTRLLGRPVHRRRWALDPQQLSVTDTIEGAGEHLVEVFLHWHPDAVLLAFDGANGEVRLGDGGPRVGVALDPQLTWEVPEQTWHPRFGEARPAWGMTGVRRGALPLEVTTRLSWKD